MDAPFREKRRGRVCDVTGCGRKHDSHGLCATHKLRWQRGADLEAPIQLHSRAGEWSRWYLNSHGYMHRVRNVDGRREVQLEHRYVMEQRLGRKLIKGENVHHKNGDKTDNRITNLELWNTSQPAGQRVQDKLAWAREMIALYADLDNDSGTP